MIIYPSTKMKDFDKVCTGELKKKALATGFMDLDDNLLLAKGFLMILTGYPGSGKALDISTPIPTPSGWTTMERLKKGDIVFDEQGQPTEVINATEVMYGHECYELVFSDGERIIADADHQWITSTRVKEVRAKSNAKKGYKTLSPIGKITTTEISQTITTPDKEQRSNHSIPFLNSLDLPDASLPLHPYLLGFWLGDGSNYNGSIHTSYPEIIKHIHSLGYETNKYAHGIQYGVSGLQTPLRLMGLLQNKHIPSYYLRSSKRQRLDLLSGLIDSDGHVTPSGNIIFYTTRKIMAENVEELLSSLGILNRVASKKANLYGKDCGLSYSVSFSTNSLVLYNNKKKKRLTNYLRPLKRRIVECNPIESVPVKCIQVASKNHMYLCGKKMVATHNSEWLDAVLLNMSILHDWKVLYFSPENHPVEQHMLKIAEKICNKKGEYFDKEDKRKAFNVISSNYTWFDPENPTLNSILEAGKEVQNEKGLDVIVIDPWNAVDHERKERAMLHENLGYSLSKILKFGRDRDILMIVVAHPTKPMKDKDGNIGMPNLYDISDGAMWRNKADYGIVVHRPDMGKNQMLVSIQKIKQKHLGKLGMILFDYDFISGRFKGIEEQAFCLPNEISPPF